MIKMLMFVYNDITTDARVQRAANALAQDFELILISTHKGKTIADNGYKNVFVGGRTRGARDIISTIWETWRIIRKLHPDIVYCHDYYSSILAYLLISTNYSGKIIYDAHELIIPEEGHSDKRLKFFYWFEKRIVNKVDLLICASDARGAIMQKHYDLIEAPIIINNISQLTISDDDSTNKILESLKPFFSAPGITVVYAGVVKNSRKIDVLFNAVAALAPQFKLLIVGNGPSLEQLKEAAKEHKTLVSFFTGSVPYTSLGAILYKCDIGFLYYPVDTLNNVYCASNKIYEYASVGLPMLANENPTVMSILNSANIGLATNDFQEGLKQLGNNRYELKKNCYQFTQDNPWEKDSSFLRTSILSSINRMQSKR